MRLDDGKNLNSLPSLQRASFFDVDGGGNSHNNSKKKINNNEKENVIRKRRKLMRKRKKMKQTFFLSPNMFNSREIRGNYSCSLEIDFELQRAQISHRRRSWRTQRKPLDLVCRRLWIDVNDSCKSKSHLHSRKRVYVVKSENSI